MFPYIEVLKLIRPVNCLLAFVGVIVGATLTWVAPNYYAAVISAAAAFLVCAAGNVVNDIVDIEIDRINRPHRVLVKGTLTRNTAWKVVGVMNLLALLFAAAVNMHVFLIAVLAVVFLFLYNFRLKRHPVVGNLIIALLAGMIFLTGGVAVDAVLTWELPGPLIGAVFAFLLHLVREIIKDAEDLDGDRSAGVTTLPMVIGVKRSVMLALSLFFLLVLFTYLPILQGWSGRWYKIIVVYIVDLPTLGLLILVWFNHSPRMLQVASVALKAGMGLGVLALLDI